MFLGRTATEQGGHLGLMALTTGGQIEAITWNTSQGFSTALSAFVAQNYAARQISRVLKAYRTTLWMTFIFGSFCTFLFICYGNEYFLSLFLKKRRMKPVRISTYRRILATIYDAGNYHTGRFLWNGAHHASCRNQCHL